MSRKSKLLDKLHSFLGVEDTLKASDTLFFESDKLYFEEARYEDIKKMMRLQKKVYGDVVTWNYTTFLTELNSKYPTLYLMAKYKDELIGFGGIRVEGSNAHISNMAILNAYQNKGVGTQILEELLTFALKKLCVSISLEVRQVNVDAQRFYQRFGFETEKILTNYYSNNQDGLLMTRQNVRKKASDEQPS